MLVCPREKWSNRKTDNKSAKLKSSLKSDLSYKALLCYLLSIRSREHLLSHPLIGSIFETFIVSECFKRFCNIAENPSLYFWRDQTGNEIDLFIQDGHSGYPLEVKLSMTYHSDFQKGIECWLALKGNKATKGGVIYCGEHLLQTKLAITVIPWWMM